MKLQLGNTIQRAIMANRDNESFVKPGRKLFSGRNRSLSKSFY